MSTALTKIIAALPVATESRVGYPLTRVGYPLTRVAGYTEYPLLTEEVKADCPSARYVGGTSRYLCECASPETCQGVRRAKLAAVGVVYTAREYMDNSREDVTHDIYYGQFVTEETVRRVASHIGIGRILASTDRHFNDIPLIEWDRMGLDYKAVEYCGLANTFTYAPGTRPQFSVADGVCVKKAAARVIKNAGLEVVTVGTEYFRNKTAARRYYESCGLSAEDFEARIEEGEVKIGKPETKGYEELKVDSDGRYIIVKFV